MAVAGYLTYNTEINKSGFEKGLNSLKTSTNSAFTQIKNIIAALGIDKIISATFNTISNSINDAISRLDTLNNYSKVMQNLGASAVDADKSLNTLSTGLDGLPTALNEAASSVQRLMASNSDIEKSTSYYLAMNDAILAGGTSAQIQSAAMEQLLQIYSTGKVESDAWISVLTAMPAQLKQVATSFGYTSTAVEGDFYTALQKGKISMDEFMDRMVLLDTEGTESITSFAQQAKDATGGIATAITNFKTRITKGVADIIDSFNKLLQDAGFGSISDIIDNISIKAKEMLDTFAEKLPDIVNFLKEISPLLVAIVTGLTAYKATLIAISAINTATRIGRMITAFIQLLPAIRSVKDAMLLLNMTFSVNPIVLIVAAIAALVAGFIYLWNTSEDFRNFWINLWESIKTAFENAWNAVVGFFTETIPNAFQGLLDKISEIGNNIKTFFENLWNSIVSFFTETIPKAFQSLLDKISEIGNNIKTFFENLWNSIVSFFTEIIPKWIQNVIDWFSNLPYMIGYQIGQILGNIIQFGVNVWNWITVDLPQIIQGIVDWFAQLPGKIWTCLLNTINNISMWGQNVWNTAITWVSNTINSIADWFSQLPGKIWTWLVNMINNISIWGQNIWNTATTWVSNTINSIVDWFAQLPRENFNMAYKYN